ncbi:unnamed protein product [Mytilus edulis]|uniref:Uncharacterized protein n=1 Tax=Mytilus edulis TaxID=6550 RepID=A0A8S3TJF4_MYTED|nr:unnamed protein product [Mytilus edulis]
MLRSYIVHPGDYQSIVEEIKVNKNHLTPQVNAFYEGNDFVKIKQRLREKFQRLVANMKQQKDPEIREELEDSSSDDLPDTALSPVKPCTSTPRPRPSTSSSLADVEDDEDLQVHMMTLRMECIKYRNMKPVKTDSLDGHQKYHVNKNVLESLLDCYFKISDIEHLLQLSERTIYRQMAHFGLQKRNFSDIDDDNLDNILSGIAVDFLRCGELMLREILKRKGIKVQRWRLREAIRRIDYDGTQERKTGRLHRRVYSSFGKP